MTMPERKFELPGIQDLSKEQEKALNLPVENPHLIVGGPGTGKSVLALIRARRHRRDNIEYQFLVYTHLLKMANDQLFDGDLVSQTWDAWYRNIFKEISKQEVPKHPPDKNNYPPIDWHRATEIIDEITEVTEQEFPVLIIDEGQDMPREFYDSLVNLGWERFYVVADQNQQITAQKSSRQEIQDSLDIDPNRVIDLRHNYRNNYQVARLAREFYTGDPASLPPELPRKVSGPIPILYTYDQGKLDILAHRIRQLSDRYPKQLIGVIAPNNKVRESYLNALKSSIFSGDNPKPSIMTFSSNIRTNIAFNRGGIVVINAQACKGLEFDTVILADIDEHIFQSDDSDRTRKLFYVMIARARERVFMFIKRNASSAVESILPTDPDVLQRKELSKSQ